MRERSRKPPSSTGHDHQPRVATRAPSHFEHADTPSGVAITVSWDDEKTTEIDLLSVDDATRAGLVAERSARRKLRDALVDQARELGNQRATLTAQSKVIDQLVLCSSDAKACADGAVMAKRLVRALAVAIALIPGAAFGAGLSFLSARDAAARASERDAVERERIRKDIDQLRADVRNNPTWSQP